MLSKEPPRQSLPSSGYLRADRNGEGEDGVRVGVSVRVPVCVCVCVCVCVTDDGRNFEAIKERRRGLGQCRSLADGYPDSGLASGG